MNQFIEDLFNWRQIQQEKDYKPAWVYHKLSLKYDLDLRQLETVAAVLGYKKGWAYHKWKEKSSNNEYKTEEKKDSYSPYYLREPLSLLGIDYPYTKAQLVSAYRQKALKTHPDTGGNSSVFMAVNKAYEQLKKHL